MKTKLIIVGLCSCISSATYASAPAPSAPAPSAPAPSAPAPSAPAPSVPAPSVPTLDYTISKPVNVKKKQVSLSGNQTQEKVTNQIIKLKNQAFLSAGIGYGAGFSYRVALGYLFGLNVGLAVGPEVGCAAYHENDHDKAGYIDVGVKARMVLFGNFYGLARAAGAYVKQTSSKVSKQSGFAATASAGFGYEINKHFSVDVSYQRLFAVSKIKMDQALLLTLTYGY